MQKVLSIVYSYFAFKDFSFLFLSSGHDSELEQRRLRIESSYKGWRRVPSWNHSPLCNHRIINESIISRDFYTFLGLFRNEKRSVVLILPSLLSVFALHLLIDRIEYNWIRLSPIARVSPVLKDLPGELLNSPQISAIFSSPSCQRFWTCFPRQPLWCCGWWSWRLFLGGGSLFPFCLVKREGCQHSHGFNYMK